MFKKLTVSAVIASALLGSSADPLTQNTESYASFEKTFKHSTIKGKEKKQYIQLVEKLLSDNTLFLHTLCSLEPEATVGFKQSVKKQIKLTEKVIKSAQERIEICKNSPSFSDLLEFERDILYSTLAVNSVLQSLVDKDLIELTGGIEPPEDIIEFGRSTYQIRYDGAPFA